MQVCFTVAGLEPATRYEVVLPAGTAYSTLNPGSVLRTEQRFQVTGVLDFTTSFRRGDFNGVDDFGTPLLNFVSPSSLLEIWFPHAFAPGTDAEDVRSVLTLQETRRRGAGIVTPQDVDFTIAFRPGSTCDARHPHPGVMRLPADIMKLWLASLAEHTLVTH